jgi:hypothetical protein
MTWMRGRYQAPGGTTTFRRQRQLHQHSGQQGISHILIERDSSVRCCFDHSSYLVERLGNKFVLILAQKWPSFIHYVHTFCFAKDVLGVRSLYASATCVDTEYKNLLSPRLSYYIRETVLGASVF